MSDADAPATAIDTHDDHDTGHGHEAPGEPLGPVDTRAWGAAILGGAMGLLVVLALFAATQG